MGFGRSFLICLFWGGGLWKGWWEGRAGGGGGFGGWGLDGWRGYSLTLTVKWVVKLTLFPQGSLI